MSKVVTFGEVMLRLATPDRLRFGQAGSFTATFGGGEANVAVSLANYGLPVEFVTRVPKNDIADSCLREVRKYAILAIFVVAAILTPPDVFSQLMMAGPMIVLYEVSIWVAVLVGKKKAEREKAAEEGGA